MPVRKMLLTFTYLDKTLVRDLEGGEEGGMNCLCERTWKCDIVVAGNRACTVAIEWLLGA